MTSTAQPALSFKSSTFEHSFPFLPFDHPIRIRAASHPYITVISQQNLIPPVYNTHQYDELAIAATNTMTSETFAAFRRTAGDDLGRLAEEHFKHDLEDSDKEALKSAAGKFSTHALVGSVVGIGLGAFLALRLRQNRMAMFKAFKTAEKPTSIKFANGREEVLPDLTEAMKPTTLGDIAAYTFFSIGGLFLGGELGALTGSWSAKRSILSNPAQKERIEKAFKAFRIDVLKKEIQDLEADNKDKELLSF